jgi:serine/threonine-protein kinase
MMTANTHALGAGSSVGSYRIVKQIGSGGMGTVFEAVHTMLPRHVAVKVLHPELLSCPGMGSRMVQEASILDGLRHPGIVRVFDCGLLDDRRPWIAMELVAGESLTAKLARETRLSPHEVCELVTSIADVLATVHERGIVHRDLKPDNLLFAASDTGCPVRVIDWGVARLGAAARLTLDGVTCGTPIYMSPEQATGRNIAAPCDIYSLGVIAYEALAGHPPFEGKTLVEVVSLHLHGDAAPLSTLCPAAPRTLCELVHQMLQKAPLQRPTATEVRDSMRALATEIAGFNPEFESYDLTTTSGPLPIAETSNRLRWTPEMPVAFPTALGWTSADTSGPRALRTPWGSSRRRARQTTHLAPPVPAPFTIDDLVAALARGEYAPASDSSLGDAMIRPNGTSWEVSGEILPTP